MDGAGEQRRTRRAFVLQNHVLHERRRVGERAEAGADGDADFFRRDIGEIEVETLPRGNERHLLQPAQLAAFGGFDELLRAKFACGINFRLLGW